MIYIVTNKLTGLEVTRYCAVAPVSSLGDFETHEHTAQPDEDAPIAAPAKTRLTKLEFIGAGPFQINGNLKGPIVDTGVQVERMTSAAFSTTAVGGSGPSAESIAAAVLAALNADPIPVNIKKVNNIQIKGVGTRNDPWNPI